MTTRPQIVAQAPQGAPSSVTPSVFSYVLRHGDDNLVLAQRLGQWISKAPELESDIALANIAVDHIGQARALLTLAGEREGSGRTEDNFAMRRTERVFTNLLLVEQPNGDFGRTMVRQLFFDAYQVLLWEALTGSADADLAAIAGKGIKEATYHLRHTRTWVVRLGDGTEESHRRMQDAVDGLWRFTGEMFLPDAVDEAMVDLGVGPDLTALRPAWDDTITAVLDEATLVVPDDPYQRAGGRSGFHTDHLGHMLGDLQWMQRTYPGMDW